jgi:hypothetical protein
MSAGETVAEQVAVARDRLYQAIAIVGLAQRQVDAEPAAALQAARDILDRAWGDLGECAGDEEEGT